MDQLRPTHPRWSLQTQDSEDLEDTDDLGSENSSELSSGPPSPIFDGPEEDGRRVLRRQKSASTISSITSSTPALPASQSEPRLCVLDARTQQEIMLDKVTYPPVDARHQNHITQKYRALHKRIQDEGLYKCNYSAYAVDALGIPYYLLSSSSVYATHTLDLPACFSAASGTSSCSQPMMPATWELHTTSRLIPALAFSSETSSGDSVWAGGNAAATSTIS